MQSAARLLRLRTCPLPPVQRPVVVQELNADVVLLERRGDIWLRLLTDEGREGSLGALKVSAEPFEN